MYNEKVPTSERSGDNYDRKLEYHHIPETEYKLHIESPDCPCKPYAGFVGYQYVYTHNSLVESV